MFEAIIQLIEQYPRIIIHRHDRPDGDAIGSQFGLKRLLRATYPEKEIYAVGDMTERYAFILEGEQLDDLPDDAFTDALCIILDTSAPALISDGRYTTAAATARLDHHIFVEKIADAEVTDTSYESCCGLVTAMAMEGGLTVPADAAKALYTGMVTDSGRFRYDSTNAQTFRLASFLMERSFDTTDIYRQLYSGDLEQAQLRARFTLKIQTTPHRVAYIYTTRDEVAECHADVFSISRGMVSTMSELRGIDSWVNFTETENGVLCELRSNRYNINPIAVKYGGGGHAKASGATVADREQAMQMLADLCQLSEENQ
ncbi:MAG: bifunctional oligoribonuclease/PAP phosphatase NrnA [Clostridia bacterium]|nr:bifunctional oligoribonuclease/PAP phosphatase NrnA [Clostridia bacterium]